MRRRIAVVLAAGLVVLGGCETAGDSGGAQAEEQSTADQDLGSKPEFEVAVGSTPPTELQVEDVVVGEGDRVSAGDRVTVHFVGKRWSTGTEFDSSWSRDPYVFTLGEGQVIGGWDRGLVGMRVGGRRQLVVPPGDAYGPRGVPGRVAPGETLVFVVDLLPVRAETVE